MRLHGAKSAESKAEAEQEFLDMQDVIKAEMSERSANITDLWSTRPMLKRTLVAVGVQVMGQFTGINGNLCLLYFLSLIFTPIAQKSVINYFGPSIYKALGLSNGQSLLVQGIYGAVGPIANFFFITLVLDTVGRKKPLVFGAGTIAVLYSILTAIVASFPPEVNGMPNTHKDAQRAGIAMIFMTSIVFSLSFGPVSWVLASEVFPTKTRSMGTSVATCANWLFNILFSQVSNLAIENISWKYYILFICLNALDFVVIALFFPETKGKTLEEMAEVFGDEVDLQAIRDHSGSEMIDEREVKHVGA
jgi:hypothetical protein